MTLISNEKVEMNEILILSFIILKRSFPTKRENNYHDISQYFTKVFNLKKKLWIMKIQFIKLTSKTIFKENFKNRSI